MGKVKKEIDKMLAASLIFPMDRVESISPIVIQDKKDSNDIKFCVDYRSLLTVLDLLTCQGISLVRSAN